jgi:hypothetical protein
MALFKKQDKKNEKEEKDLQAVKNAGKVSLDDEVLDAVAGGTRNVGTEILRDFPCF